MPDQAPTLPNPLHDQGCQALAHIQPEPDTQLPANAVGTAPGHTRLEQIPIILVHSLQL
jgi:hypothetical protein